MMLLFTMTEGKKKEALFFFLDVIDTMLVESENDSP